jgi:O-antigen/teichoic acid export membrane protein
MVALPEVQGRPRVNTKQPKDTRTDGRLPLRYTRQEVRLTWEDYRLADKPRYSVKTGKLHKEVLLRMASTSLDARPRQTQGGVKAATRPRTRPCSAARIDRPARSRIASNFAFLSAAELICRTTSVFVTLSLAKRLGVDGYGRIEFAFSVVFLLVLLLRDSSDVIVARELSRHPRLIRPLVDQVLAYKTIFALVLFSLLALVGSLTLAPSDSRILALYGTMLFTTAIGLDFVFRGTERMGLVAVSLCVRTGIYAFGVLALVRDSSRIAWVPVWLTAGELSGIALVWLSYLKYYRLPRPRLSPRFLFILVQRGRTVCLIQLSQAVINSADLLVVGFLSVSSDVGRYGAPHRMVTALLTFGLILQQAAFPALSRLWRQTAGAGQEALDSLVEVLMTGLVPVAVGCTVLADPLVHLFLPNGYAGAGFLLALGIWRAPLLILAYLYQITLIALNRETVGVRTLVAGAVVIVPLVALLRLSFGLPGAVAGVLLVGLALVLAGYGCLVREGRQPAWHHHLARPVLGSLAMIPVCMVLKHSHVLLAVFGGAITYIGVWLALGGLRHTRLWGRALWPLARSGTTS